MAHAPGGVNVFVLGLRECVMLKPPTVRTRSLASSITAVEMATFSFADIASSMAPTSPAQAAGGRPNAVCDW